MTWIRSVRRFLMAVAGVVAVGIVAAISDDKITWLEWVQLAVQAFGAGGVWLAANTATGVAQWAKGIMAGGAALAGVIAATLANGGDLTTSVIVNAVVAALFAAGVLVVDNDQREPSPP